VDSSGSVYIADSDNQRVLKETLSSGSYTQSIVADAVSNGIGGPYGIAVDGSGDVFLTDPDNSQVLLETPSGNGYTQSTVANYESYGVGLDASGNVYIGDYNNNRVLKESPSAGSYIQSVVPAELQHPAGVAVDASGNLYIADTYNSRVVEEIKSGGNFGTVNVGVSSTYWVTSLFTFDSGGTLASTAALTQGAQGLDFNLSESGSCVIAEIYNVGDSCGVDVWFTPRFPGSRYGGVQLSSPSGPIATAYLQGAGLGPELVFPGNPAVQTLGGDFYEPFGVAVDGSGNVYVADQGHNLVKEMPAGCPSSSCVTTLGGGFIEPSGVAVDGSGNVYVADQYHSLVKEMPAGCASSSCVTTLGGGFSLPAGVAVDGSGNVYVGDTDHSIVREMPPGCASPICTTTLGGGFSQPWSVAVDGAGNVYVADTPNNAVKEMPPGCTADNYNNSLCTITTLGGGFALPFGVAVDGSGNVYVADTGNNQVKEMPPGCASSICVTTLAGGLKDPEGVALDGAGNVYVADLAENAVYELNFATPPTLSFANAPVGSESSDSPKAVTLMNIGNAPLTFQVPASGENPSLSPDFTLDASTTCPEVLSSSSSPGTLATGASCVLAADFIPTTFGAVTGALVLTDNATSATQTIPLAGTGLYAVWIVDGTGGSSELNGNGGGGSSTDPGQNIALAADYLGNIWTIGSGTPPLEETTASGTLLNQIAANTGGLVSPTAIAIDGASQIWVANGNNSISLFTNAGAPLSPSAGFTASGLSTPSAVAVDLDGSVWIANKGNNTMTRFLGAAAPVAPIATSVANNTTGAKP
jgi:streptogramin lyase